MNLKESLEKIQKKNCVIEVFGLGYVGFPLSMRLAKSGFQVIGIDTDPKKIQNLKEHTLVESQLEFQKQFLETIKKGKFTPSERPLASEKPKVGIISVPTPIPSKDVTSDFFVVSAVEKFLDTAKAGDVIILESSIEIGTTEKISKIIESKGYKVGNDFGLCFCPERIDPLNKKWNLANIPRVIYCSDDTTFNIAKKIYQHVNNSKLVRVESPKIAEVVKSFENTFRLVNISLVNELAILCDKLKINVKDVIDAASTKPFGFMPFYSGAGVGGHCIPKDPRFLLESAKRFGTNFSTIENALAINSIIPRYIAETIENELDTLKLEKSVLVCGLSYKPDIEDMRDSPGFKILDEFSKKGISVSAYDPFFKHELLDKYLIENHLSKFDFKVLPNLDESSIKTFSCICIVQHHSQIEQRLEEIYKKSLVPLIYDCQNKLAHNESSKTILKGLGN
jgi:UDP-N-acetyl-D-glucosamine dehydrogenase